MIPSFSTGASKNGEINAEKRAALGRMQSEYSIFEQDFKKKARYQNTLDMEIRRLKLEMERLEIRIEEKQTEREKLSRELGILEMEGKRLKRKMNLLS